MKDLYMAKIQQQKLIITLSQLKRDTELDDENRPILSDEDLATIVEAMQSFAGDKVLIEIE